MAIEDNLGGVASARAAGVAVVAFPNGNTVDHDFGSHPGAWTRVDLEDLAGMSESTRPTARPARPATETAFRVEAYEKIDYTLDYVDGVFDPDEPRSWPRRSPPGAGA